MRSIFIYKKLSIMPRAGLEVARNDTFQDNFGARGVTQFVKYRSA